MEIKKTIELLPHQKKALMSGKRKVMMRCGIGSGKSYLGAVWTLKKLKESPKSTGLITANSYSQLQKATLDACTKLYTELGIPFNWNAQKHLLTIAHSKRFYCLSLDNYDLHRGIEIGEWWADELAYSKEDAYNVMMGRLRDKHGKLDCLFTSTPKGMNWMFDYFSETGDKFDKDNTEVIVARSSENTHLPPSYVDDLRLQYGETLSRQELDAEYVRLGSGLTYYAFNLELVSDCHLLSGQTVLIGLDFNVNPYCAVLAHFDGQKLHIFDECYLENSNTPEMIKAIRSKIGINKAQIYPDSTQFKRNTLGITDFEMLQKEFEIIRTHNPFVIDRVNNINRLLEQKRIIIAPRCKNLINDLNKVSWKDRNLELDQTTDKRLTHVSDALSYLAWAVLPFRPVIPARVGNYA